MNIFPFFPFSISMKVLKYRSLLIVLKCSLSLSLKQKQNDQKKTQQNNNNNQKQKNLINKKNRFNVNTCKWSYGQA